jgi:replicative DNA helicase
MFLTEAENYKRNLRVADVLHDSEEKYIKFLVRSYEMSGSFPSETYFCQNFPEVEAQILAHKQSTEFNLINPEDIRHHIFRLIDLRTNDYIARRMSKLQDAIKAQGITAEIADELVRLQHLSNRNQADQDVSIEIDGRANYNALLARPAGLKTGVRAVDERIGGMNEGTVTTIAGFTSQYKTTFAVNIAHLNAYNYCYNIAYITLETPKNDMYWNLLSCHSFDRKFTKFPFIGHDEMRQTKLEDDPAKRDYLFDVVEKDLTSPMVLPDGTTQERGRVIFLDESDFNYFTFSEITQVLEKLDDKLGGKLDALIVDYIQLCKFSDSTTINDNETSTINAYVSFFRRLSQNFRKVVDANGEEHVKQLSVILLSQIRRDSWRKAVNHGGVYDVTCMSDSSELEKSSHRIMTTFTTEELKERKIAQVQILKNRTGQTMQAEPAEVFADGEAYVFCDEDGMDANVFAGNDQTASLTAAFNASSSIDALL